MIILFIDDMQERHDIAERIFNRNHKLLHAFNYDEAIDIFQSSSKIGLALFDHDIEDYACPNCDHKLVYNAGAVINHPYDLFCDKCQWIYSENSKIIERTGSTIASYILNNLDEKHLPARVIAHSSNYHGGMNIVSKFSSYGIHAEYKCFSPSMLETVTHSLIEQ